MGKYETLECGQGTPLLMCHGLLGAPKSWLPLFPYLPKTCRAVSLRFPFFQDGERLDSVSAATDYAQGYLREAGCDRAVLLGNSIGGHVALNLALREPDRICGMVLSGSSGLFERSFTTVPGTHPPRQWVWDRAAEVFYEPSKHVTDKLVDEICQLISIRQNARDLVHIAKSAKRDHVAARLHLIRCPTLVIWGRQDTVTPAEVAEEFHQGIAGSELEWLEECGHAAAIERPREFGAALCGWWDRYICPAGAHKPDGAAP